jgi:hypothetical protein
MARSPRRSGAALAALFTVTPFVASSLLFLIEPMVGKLVLPLCGGAASVWNVCLVFFQAAVAPTPPAAESTPAAAGITIRRRLPIEYAPVLGLALAMLRPRLLAPVAVGRSRSKWVALARDEGRARSGGSGDGRRCRTCPSWTVRVHDA